MSSAKMTCLEAFKLVIPSLLENLALFQALATVFFSREPLVCFCPSPSHDISFSTAHFLYKVSIPPDLVPTKSTWHPKEKQRPSHFWSESGKPSRVGTSARGVELKLVKLPSTVFHVPLLPFPCYYLWEDQWFSLSWSPWHCLKTAWLTGERGWGRGGESWCCQTCQSFSPAVASLPSLTHQRGVLPFCLFQVFVLILSNCRNLWPFG